MKNKITFLLLFVVGLTFAQCPTNLTTYYASATGSGATLKTQLYNIIKNHTDRGYAGLWTTYQTSDRDVFTGTGYENDNTIYDLYSENPNGVDPYNFTYSTSQCGTYAVEGDCYNREHMIPQSSFGSAAPMVSDAHFIPPTDGKVNGYRSDFPHGIVATVSRTMMNGSKMGSSGITGYTGTVYEPLDAFKGDIARMYFYYVTRYEDKLATTNYEPFDKSTHPAIYSNFLAMLIQWHNNDPVSAFEIARNNAICARQNNRNPFIDHPEWVASIWGSGSSTDTTPPSAATSLNVTGTTSNSASLSWIAATDNIAVTSYDIYVDGVLTASTNSTSYTITGLASSTTFAFYIVARDAAGNSSVQSNTANGTTLASTGGSCSTSVNETFETIPANASTYTVNTWTNGGITWTATDSRTDQTINTRAITIRNLGSLTASTFADGIGSLTVTTQLKFTGTAGTFNLKVNGNVVGTIPYSATATTTTIPNINVAGSVVISIDGNSTTTNRVAFDDLTWNCYATLNNTTFNDSEFKIIPNPSNGNFKVEIPSNFGSYNLEMYSLLGQKIDSKFNTEETELLYSNLSKGIYILKITKDSQSIVKKIVIN